MGSSNWRRWAAALISLLVLVGDIQAQPARQEVLTNIVTPPAPDQPLPYSHKIHIAQGLQCRMCHTNPDPGTQMTFPATNVCMSCHMTIARDRPGIQKLSEYARSNEPIPWKRVYQITTGVTWSHRKHLQAGMQCVMCHGDVGRLDVMAETTAVPAMATCISCHQAHNAKTSCATCHSWPTD